MTAAHATARPLDAPTVLLGILLVGGLVTNAAAAITGWLPLPVATVVAALLLNCAFTVWHEAVHGNVSDRPWLNNAVGIAAAWVSLTPYFRIRQVHREHHAFTNDPVRDPDYWHVSGPFWGLPWRYPRGMRRYRAVAVSLAGRVADAAGYAAAAVVIAAACLGGHATTVIAVWLLPKGLTLVAHAWYVNYLPHHGRPQGRFTSARIVERVGWLQPFMLFHNYHGLHHAHQRIPWHRYRRELARRRESLRVQGTPIFQRLGDVR